jgi:hypothetical protein
VTREFVDDPISDCGKCGTDKRSDEADFELDVAERFLTLADARLVIIRNSKKRFLPLEYAVHLPFKPTQREHDLAVHLVLGYFSLGGAFFGHVRFYDPAIT